MSNPSPGPAASVLSPTAVVAGRYRITAALSSAGPSTAFATYEALDLKSDSAAGADSAGDGLPYVILRVLADSSIGRSVCPLTDADRAQLAQQAAALRRVRHPAVARTLELGLHSELGLYLAREPVERDGQTLRELLAARGGPLPEAEAIKLCAQIGEALEAVHQQGACHLGLSPSCVYVYKDGLESRVKVVDFGLLPPGWVAQLGEPGYLAPEQVSGQVSGQLGGPLDAQSCDRRTDQFALAVILYEMLAGQPAFVAAADEDRQIILSRVRNEDPLPLAQSRAVEQALARALSRSRGVRFPSVRDFVQALGADVSGWPSRPAPALLPASVPVRRPPRLLLPMIAGAVFSMIGLSAVGGLQRITQKPVQGLFSNWWPRSPEPTVPRLPVDTGKSPSGTVAGVPDLASEPVPDLAAAAPSSPPVPPGGDGVDGGSRAPDALPPDGPESLPRGVLVREDPTRVPLKKLGFSGAVTTPGLAASGLSGPLTLAFSGPEAEALTSEQRGELTRCVKMISPRAPFSIALQNINGVFYVDPNRTSAELSGSQDFRDCLKLSVRGKIVPKVLIITKMIKGKAAP